MIILITGPKHSGKTLCAAALEKLTGVEASDLDRIVERDTGKNPRELYREGPGIFREAEAAALSSLIRETAAEGKLRIIAAGGGLIDNPEALALIDQNREAVLVYLDISAETAWQRIQHSAKNGELPPFLDTENPGETHRALHRRRAEAYRALAGFTVSAENRSPEEIAEEITGLLKSRAAVFPIRDKIC